MARKAQSKWEQVSDLVGRIELSVSGKAWTDKNGNEYAAIPETKGFYVEITYENAHDLKYHALCNSRVAVQSTLKAYFWEHGKFPVQPGKLFKATSNGGMDVPNTVLVDRAVATAAISDLADKIRFATALGLPIPAEWLAAQAAVVPGTTSDDQGEEENAIVAAELKYDVEELRKTGTQKLRQLAQDDGMDGYATKPRNELVDMLAVVTK